MIVERNNTRKGLVVRFIFKDKEEYEMSMKVFSIFSQEMGEGNNKYMESLITLFRDYYEPNDKYYDGKPTVTVFEDHILTLATQIESFYDLYISMKEKNIKLLEEKIKLLEEKIELMKKIKEINYDNT